MLLAYIKRVGSQGVLHTVLGIIGYAFEAVAVIGLLNWLRIKVFLHARKPLVCSGYCVQRGPRLGANAAIGPRAAIGHKQP
jgi:hypothetical protein